MNEDNLAPTIDLYNHFYNTEEIPEVLLTSTFNIIPKIKIVCFA